MKAVVYSRYGTPDVLSLREVEQPKPVGNQVRVRVSATSVNASDWEFLTGTPFYARIAGLRKPRFSILGADVAGVVDAVGPDVARLAPGDEVFGDIIESLGGFAESACAPESSFALKPAALSFVDASTLPQAATVALQVLRDKARVQPDQRVLINGAGGGVGTFAVQIASSMGAEVTAVDAAAKLDLVRSLGADHAIDYQTQDFTRNGTEYDAIVDVVGNRSIADLKRALTATGVYSVIGGRVLPALVVGGMVSLTSARTMGVFAWKPTLDDLDRVAEMCVAGTIRPVIDREYALAETADALRALGARSTFGIGVVDMAR